jgi:hypothetical protein
MMYTRTVLFEAVTRRQTVDYKCKRCCIKRSKIVKVEYTVNPFNKNADGVPKSRQEVAQDASVELQKRVAEVKAGEACNKCKDEIVAEREAARRESTTQKEE